MKKLLLLLPFLVLLACKDNADIDPNVNPNEEPLVTAQQKAAEILDSQVSITGVPAQFNPYQSVKLSYSSSTGIIFKPTYDANNNLKAYAEGDEEAFLKFQLLDNKLEKTLAGTVETFEVNDQNLAVSKLNESSFLFYKDGYMVAEIKASGGCNGLVLQKRTYNEAGNLIRFERQDQPSGGVVTYEYTDLPNTINQEFLQSQIGNEQPRNAYFGKFSTNLIKKMSFTEGQFKTITFEYEFDAQNRVSKVIALRTDINGQPLETTFSYSY